MPKRQPAEKPRAMIYLLLTSSAAGQLSLNLGPPMLMTVTDIQEEVDDPK